MGRIRHQLPNPWLEPVLSIPAAGALVHLSRSAAYRAAAGGTLPTVALGGRRVVPTAELYRQLGLPVPPHSTAVQPRIIS